MRKIIPILIGVTGVTVVAAIAYEFSKWRAEVDDVFDEDIVCEDSSFDEDEFGRGDPLTGRCGSVNGSSIY